MIIFPSNLGEGGHGSRPFTHFKAITPQGTGEDIFLPIPAGLSFNDGGNYGTIDMGALGAFFDASYSMQDHSQDGEKTSIASHVGSIAREMSKAMVGTAANQIAGTLMPGTHAKAMAAMKLVPNPSQSVTFSGNTLREFNFQFTLVGRSEKDTETIRTIHNTFRTNVYPEATRNEINVFLEYPPVWNIRFINGASPNKPENEWLPKIHQCYLTLLTTNINPSALMYKVDYSPAELQLSLTFQETRTLMRYDIEEELNAGANRRG